jgi:hypothetical protein
MAHRARHEHQQVERKPDRHDDRRRDPGEPRRADAPAAQDALNDRLDVGVAEFASGRGSELIIAASIQRRGAQFVGLARGDRRAAVAPGGADIGDDRGDLVVGQGCAKGGMP